MTLTKLCRLGRSAADLYAISKQLQEKGVHLRVLDQQIDTGTISGKALFGMLAVFAEFERDIGEERRTEGMRRYHAKLAAQGRKPGPEPRIDATQIKALRADGLLIRDIMARLHVSKASVYRALSAEIRR